MPVLIAVLVASGMVGIALMAVARQASALDPTDVAPVGEHVLVAESARHPRFEQFLLQRRDPQQATGLFLTVALAVAAVATLAVGLLLEMVQTNQGFARWDGAAARWGAARATGANVQTTLKLITSLGSTPVVIVVAVVVSIVEYLRIRSRAVPLFLATVIASELGFNNLVKFLVGRDRPNIARLVHAAGSSFPSGHTASSAATYAAIALIVGRRRSRRTRAVLAGAAGAITVAVASSRVLLGAHWLTDVIAGAMLGWGCFALCSTAYGGRLLHFGQPVEEAQGDVVADIHDTGKHDTGMHETGMGR